MRFITKFVLFVAVLAVVKPHYVFSESNDRLIKKDVERLLSLMRTVTGNMIDINEFYGIPVNSDLRRAYKLSSSKAAGNSESLMGGYQQLNADIAIIKRYRNMRDMSVLKIKQVLRSIDKKLAASYTMLPIAIKQLDQSSNSNFEERANLLKKTVTNISSMLKNDLKPIARNQGYKAAKCLDVIELLWEMLSECFDAQETTTTTITTTTTTPTPMPTTAEPMTTSKKPI